MVLLPKGVHPVPCRWVFTIKYHLDGSIERYKALLVAKRYAQTPSIDLFETFSPVSRLSSVHVLVSIAVNLDWPMYQLDVKNAFLYDNLTEEVYMEQPPRFGAQGEAHLVCN